METSTAAPQGPETVSVVANADELKSILRQRLILQKKLNSAIRACGVAYYRPMPKQDAFHRAGNFKRRMVRAGNRFGKSTLGCAEDIAWLLGERPWYPKDDPARTLGIPQHPVKGLTISTDWDIIDQIWTSQRGDSPGKVWKFMPPSAVKHIRRNNCGTIDMIELKNGSVWRFDSIKSWLSNPQGSESADWDFIHVDEPCPEQMFKAAARGLIDRGGAAWFTLTPLTEFWINDYFFPADTGGLARNDVWTITGSIYDNTTLNAAAIADYANTLSEDERQCRLMGIPLHLAGLVYKEFNWDQHVLKQLPSGWKSWTEPPADYSIYYAIDPHPRTPHAVLFCAVNQLNQRFYFYDHFRHCSIAELSADIRPIVEGRHVVAVRVDPCAYIEDPVTKDTWANEFWRCSIPVEKATKALAQGIIHVQGELKYKPQMVWFTPLCRRTLWEIQRYAWDEENDKPIDKDDHMMENLYRLELLKPTWVEPASSSPIEDLVITRPSYKLEDLEYANN